MAELKGAIEESFWDEDPEQLATLLSSAHEADHTVRATALLPGGARRTRERGEPAGSPLAKWLETYGHLARPRNLTLATPRWRERPEDLLAMARRLAMGRIPPTCTTPTSPSASKRASLHNAVVGGRPAGVR